jgi:hypothetical protein
VSGTGATGPLGFEAFGTACGLAVVAGALSVVVPEFSVLTATLVALALAGWASLRRRGPPVLGWVRARFGPYALSFGALAAAAGLYVDPSGPIGLWRSLVLGLGVVPLWVVERARVPNPGAAAGVR